MVKIRLANGCLDLKEEETIEVERTAYLFQDSLMDEWTNDFTIPATTHNLYLLDVQGLLYASNQRYGNEIRPCILEIEGQSRDARLQVVQVREDEIDICLYINQIPDVLKGKTLRDFFQDDSSTIIPWWKQSTDEYPAWFPEYYYGMKREKECAQLHPSKPLNAILREVETRTGISIQNPYGYYYLMASHKNVCPQNPYQAIKGTLDNNKVVFMGGKHITNSISKSTSSSIDFNRSCTLSLILITSYCSSKQWTEISANVRLVVKGEGDAVKDSKVFSLPTAQWVNHTVSHTYTLNLEKGDRIEVELTEPQKYNRGFKMLFYCTYSSYDITDDDYGEELEYIPDFSRVNPYVETGEEVTGMTIYTGGDGRLWVRQGYEFRTKNGTSIYSSTVFYPLYYYSYIGYWSNVENCKITDLLYNIGYLEGYKASYDFFTSSFYFLPPTQFDLGTVHPATFTPTSSLFGQHNYITFKGEDTKDLTPISTIDSIYLEEDKVVKELIFTPNKERYIRGEGCVSILQYSNPVKDEDTGEWSCDWEDVEGVTLLGSRIRDNKTFLQPIHSSTNGLEKITSVMEIEIEDRSYRNFTDVDYIYVNGVKCMVTDTNTTLSPLPSSTQIRAIIIPEHVNN